MGSVSVDTAINDETKNILIGSSNILKSDIKGKIKGDFSDFYDLSLFNSQLDNISEAIDSLIECHESFISVISENKLQWEETNVEVAKEDGFFRGVRKEMKKVVWPKAGEVAKNTFAVIIFCAILIAFFTLVVLGVSYLKELFS